MSVKIVVETSRQMEQVVEQLRSMIDQPGRTANRRGRRRLPFAALGTVVVDELTETNEPIYITTRDISAKGLGFLSRRHMEKGRRLIITLETDAGEIEVPATVMHCTGTVGMYKIGVRFDLVDPDAN